MSKNISYHQNQDPYISLYSLEKYLLQTHSYYSENLPNMLPKIGKTLCRCHHPTGTAKQEMNKEKIKKNMSSLKKKEPLFNSKTT